MKALWLLAAYLMCVSAFGWLALTLDAHWHQVRSSPPAPARAVRTLRALGAAGLLLSLLACLRADHVSMAALVWVMTMAAAALTVAFTLSWRPLLLAPLVIWIRTPAS